MLTELVLDKMGVFYDDVLKKKHGSTKEYTYGEVIERILAGQNGAAKNLFPEIGEQTFNRMMKRLFPNTRLNGGNETWKYYLLSIIEHKQCHKCGNIKSYVDYHKDKSSSTGLTSECAGCISIYQKDQYRKYYDLFQKSFEKNKHKIRARRIQYNYDRSLRIVPWTESEEINKFYENCPDGYHVDHIIPLKGKIVSGLHVLANLQYLTVEENLRKGNKFETDYQCESGEIG